MVKLSEFKSSNEPFVSMCAPMVRCSKLSFRLLVREFGCDIAYTPMILADSFIQSKKAREMEFSTSKDDRPLIVQFASHDPFELATAAYSVQNASDGVDLNCGCPQRWAIHEGIGCALLKRPDLMCEMIKVTRRTVSSNFSVSAKIRLISNENPRKIISHTSETLKRLERSGVDWITIHARTPAMRNEPAMWDVVSEVIQAANLQCDVVINGDINSLTDAREACNITGCNGVMAARGLLKNPALFLPETDCQTELNLPWKCANKYLQLGILKGESYSQLKQHLFWMLEPKLNKTDRALLHSMGSVAGIVNFMKEINK